MISQAKDWRSDKKTTSERGYNSRWRKARDTFLKKRPLCVFCEEQGKAVAATVVDHIKPHNGDQKLFWDQANWQPLCKFHHDSHKKRIENRGIKPGADSSGMPIDANHPWYRGK